MATQFFKQVAKDWSIDNGDHLQHLQWAVKLHEVGLSISHDQFHKHAAYLVEYSDLPGFSREEQHALAVIVRGQRRSFPRKELRKLPDELQQSTERLTVLLRLAMVFNRGRSEQTDTFVALTVKEKGLRLDLPTGWLSEHPLTESDLLREAEYLKDIGLKLKIRESIPN